MQLDKNVISVKHKQLIRNKYRCLSMYQVVGIIECDFLDWPLSLSHRHLMFLQVFHMDLYFLFISSHTYCLRLTVHLSAHLLKDLVARFGN